MSKWHACVVFITPIILVTLMEDEVRSKNLQFTQVSSFFRSNITLTFKSYATLHHPMMYSHTIFGDPSWFGIEHMLQTSFFFVLMSNVKVENTLTFE